MKAIAVIMLILAACLSACNTTGIATSQPAIIFQPGAIVVTLPVTVQPGAVVMNWDGTITVNGHVFSETRPATESSK